MQDQHLNAAITRLRNQIRYAGKQFRQHNDNSTSLFHPEQGFVYAYEILRVEMALNEFEEALAQPPVAKPVDMKEAVIEQAQKFQYTHPSSDTREFATAVLDVFTKAEARMTNILPFSRQIDWSEPDNLN